MDTQGIWNVSPAYDITFSKGEGYTKEHQLSVKGKTTNFIKSDLLSVAVDHSISLKWANEVIDEIVEKFSSFSQRARRLGINKEKIEKVAKSHRLYLGSESGLISLLTEDVSIDEYVGPDTRRIP